MTNAIESMKSQISPEEAAAAIELDRREREAAAASEIAAVCEKHGVQLVPHYQFFGAEIRGDVLIQAR
jgi:hypothetical protein